MTIPESENRLGWGGPSSPNHAKDRGNQMGESKRRRDKAAVSPRQARKGIEFFDRELGVFLRRGEIKPPAGYEAEPGFWRQVCGSLAVQLSKAALFAFVPPDSDDQKGVFTDWASELCDAGINPVPFENCFVQFALEAFAPHIVPKNAPPLTAGMLISANEADKRAYTSIGFLRVGRHGWTMFNGPVVIDARPPVQRTPIGGYDPGENSIFHHGRFTFLHGAPLVADNFRMPSGNALTSDSINAGILLAATRSFLGAITTKSVVREQVDVRDRRGTAAPGDASFAIIVDTTRSAPGTDGGCSGRTVRPHWRRGHLRHLMDGRILQIAPTMVNSNMTDDLPLPRYVIDRQNDGRARADTAPLPPSGSQKHAER